MVSKIIEGFILSEFINLVITSVIGLNLLSIRFISCSCLLAKVGFFISAANMPRIAFFITEFCDSVFFSFTSTAGALVFFAEMLIKFDKSRSHIFDISLMYASFIV